MEDDNLQVCRGAKNEVPGTITQHVVLSFVPFVLEPRGFLFLLQSE